MHHLGTQALGLRNFSDKFSTFDPEGATGRVSSKADHKEEAAAQLQGHWC
jgi:hypothetical protein